MYFEPREHLARAGARFRLGVSSAHFSVSIISALEGEAPLDSEIREAQRLRYRIFSGEMGAHLRSSRNGIDEDIYDAFCDHLIVRDNLTQQVVGTYRILPPASAERLGYYSDTEFLTTRLNHLKPNLVEFGRSCVHPGYRSGAVFMLLWAALAQYMLDHGYEHVIGCASISMRDGGHQAASLFNRLKVTHFAPARISGLSAQPAAARQALVSARGRGTASRQGLSAHRRTNLRRSRLGSRFQFRRFLHAPVAVTHEPVLRKTLRHSVGLEMQPAFVPQRSAHRFP